MTTCVKDGEARWSELCSQQGWTQDSKVLHLESFLRERNLFGEFAGFAGAIANKENGDHRREVLESVGYEIKPDPDQPTLWVWLAPTDSCEASFVSEQEALESAWNDASGQVCSVLVIAQNDWARMDLERQMDLVLEVLSSEFDAPRAEARC